MRLLPKATVTQPSVPIKLLSRLLTAQPDIFVGGDCYTGPKFAIDAIAAGKEAAISLHRFVHPGQTLTAGRDRR